MKEVNTFSNIRVFATVFVCLLFISMTAIAPANASLDDNKHNELTDFSGQLIDIKGFKFLKSRGSCNDLAKQPTVVVAVSSDPVNFNRRFEIRNTWGYKDPRALLIFLIGYVNDKYLQHKIEVESDLYGDMIQGNFVEGFRNSTYKHVMALKWFTYNCPDVPFLVKVNDDVLVNTPLLYKYLGRPSEQSQELHSERLILCEVISDMPVNRDVGNKYFASFEEYSKETFPSFCQGSIILYSSDVISELHRMTETTKYFWADDVYVTGIIALKLNLPLAPHSKYLLSSDANEPFLFALPPSLGPTQFKELWATIRMNINPIDLL